uniref:Retrovirus-related Pol polyprotein from transposon TNT 1-94 n=1 Tax=Tanacetum cinerariifolium TaxID=118510 RepID=A0A699UH34_TANCI|nr:hypothetical protein [Tanacetum cinerariifolium]
MVGRSLNVDNDTFQSCEDNEEVLGPEVPYLSAIGALMYLTSCTRPDISFAVNLLARRTTISWRSQKQTLVATSSNHAEVIALHEASRECVWLRYMTQLILTSCGLENDRNPTLIYEDNSACVSQMKK